MLCLLTEKLEKEKVLLEKYVENWKWKHEKLLISYKEAQITIKELTSNVADCKVIEKKLVKENNEFKKAASKVSKASKVTKRKLEYVEEDDNEDEEENEEVVGGKGKLSNQESKKKTTRKDDKGRVLKSKAAKNYVDDFTNDSLEETDVSMLYRPKYPPMDRRYPTNAHMYHPGSDLSETTGGYDRSGNIYSAHPHQVSRPGHSYSPAYSVPYNVSS